MIHFAWTSKDFEWLPMELLQELRDRLKTERPLFDDHHLMLLACLEDTIRWSPRRESTPEEIAVVKAWIKKQNNIRRKIRRAGSNLFAELQI